MKKALIVATISDFIAAFEINDILILKKIGYEVHVAANFRGMLPNNKEKLNKVSFIRHQLDIERTPYSISNVKAYKELKRIIKRNFFDIVHCHTPVGGVLARMCTRNFRKKGTEVLYTAHGFHFYEGAPLKNWAIYYPVEWLCSWWTDTLITINKEDYKRAKKNLHAKRIEYIPGVGIDVHKFGIASGGEKIRRELGIDSDRFMLLSVGELNENKNHKTVIKAVAGINLTYVIVGRGKLYEHLKTAAEIAGVDIRLTGYRSDVADFYDAADAYILPSIREGLNVSLMEAMASGLPCLCGNIRGNTDLIDEKGGYLFNPQSVDEIKDSIKKLMVEDRAELGKYNLKKIHSFSIQNVKNQMMQIYTISEITLV